MKQIYRPNKEWAIWIFGMVGIAGVYLLFSTFEFKSVLIFSAAFVVLIPIGYILWVKHTYILIDEESGTVAQISTKWSHKEYQIRDIVKISWTGNTMDAVNISFKEKLSTMTLSPGLYDKPTLKEIVKNIIALNPSIELAGRIQKSLEIDKA